jgi:hypothetical protein
MFREAQENYRPRFNEWMFLQQANQRAADLEWQRFWDEWTYNNPSATTIYNAGQDGPPDVGRR